jgi:hypothetical protein
MSYKAPISNRSEYTETLIVQLPFQLNGNSAIQLILVAAQGNKLAIESNVLQYPCVPVVNIE